MESMDGLVELVACVRQELRERGLHSTLGFLNRRTLHRYTGVYLIDPPLLRSHCLYDRENPAVHSVSDLVLANTYCGLSGATDQPLLIPDAFADPRLEGHPSRLAIQSYVGVPLRDSTNRCFGKICHWDTRPRMLDGREVAALRDVAPLVAVHVQRERRHRPGPTAKRQADGPTSGHVDTPTSALPPSQGAEVRVHEEANQLRR